MIVRKAVFPVAGFGTRFLPATKAMPKELLPIIDKPLIQFAVEEAISAGLDTLIFVTGKLRIILMVILSWKINSENQVKMSKRIWSEISYQKKLSAFL